MFLGVLVCASLVGVSFHLGRLILGFWMLAVALLFGFLCCVVWFLSLGVSWGGGVSFGVCGVFLLLFISHL